MPWDNTINISSLRHTLLIFDSATLDDWVDDDDWDDEDYWEDWDELLRFIKPLSVFYQEGIRSGSRARFSLPPGNYVFYILAFHNNDLVAEGYTIRNIRAGNNGLIEIEMFEIYAEDSDSGPIPPPPPLPPPISITVLNAPTGPSREGMPPNLEGLIAQVLFADGTLQVINDTRQFATVPGIMHAEMGFTNVPVHIFFPHSHLVLSGPVIIPTVIPIVIPNGYHITGTTQPQYGDRMPNFAGLVAEAHYTDGVTMRLPLGLENIFSDLMSDHPSNTGTNLPNGINPATGTLFILISRGLTYEDHKVVLIPLQALHLVTGIQLEEQPNWTTTFYVNDPPTAFTNGHLSSSGLTLRITYSSGSSRVITIGEFLAAVHMGRAEITPPNFGAASNPASVFVGLRYYGHLINIPVPVVNSPRP